MKKSAWVSFRKVHGPWLSTTNLAGWLADCSVVGCVRTVLYGVRYYTVYGVCVCTVGVCVWGGGVRVVWA